MEGGGTANNLWVLLRESSSNAEIDGEGAVDRVNLEDVVLHFAIFFTDNLTLVSIIGISAGHFLRLLGLSSCDYLKENADVGFVDKV